MAEIYEVYDIYRKKFISIREAIKNPQLYRSYRLKCVSCGDEMELVYGVKKQYFRHKSVGSLHMHCPQYSGYASNSVENIFYNKFKNIVENKISYLCCLRNNILKFYLHIPSFSNDEVNTLTSCNAMVSIISEKEKIDLKLRKEIFTKNNSILIELKNSFNIAHLQLFVKDKFVGVYKILGLDFGSLLKCFSKKNDLFIYDNARIAYLNKRYVIFDNGNSSCEKIEGLIIEKTINIDNRVAYIVKISKISPEVQRFFNKKGASVRTYETYADEYERIISEDLDEEPFSSEETPDYELFHIEKIFKSYITVGGFLYHRNIDMVGSVVREINESKITCFLPNGTEKVLSISDYFFTLKKLVKYETMNKIKLGSLFSSKEYGITNGLVCGMNGSQIMCILDSRIVMINLSQKKKKNNKKTVTNTLTPNTKKKKSKNKMKNESVKESKPHHFISPKNAALLKTVKPSPGLSFYNQNGEKCIIYKIANGEAFYRSLSSAKGGKTPLDTNNLVYDYKKNKTYLIFG